ncbi:MAG: folate-binding protein YgfZ [Rickettsiaceae bacterium]
MYNILKDRVIVKISGKDACDFLQNLVTNDVKNNDYCYSYMITNRGRYLFDFFILKDEGRFLLDVNLNQSQELIKKLMMYKLNAKVDIELDSNYTVLYAKEALVIPNIVIRAIDPRYKALGYRFIVHGSKECMNNTLLNLSNTMNEFNNIDDLYLQDKYRYAIVDGYCDLIQNKSIPLEYGAKDLNAISYSKGCYVGQEVMSRTTYQGVLRKSIFKLTSREELDHLTKNNDIMIGDTKLGILLSSYQNQALALIKNEEYEKLSTKQICIDNMTLDISRPQWTSCRD